ncbi:polymer-forming cytoskeletal protein [Aliikangiella marina]|uniref:Polymer-forming cytoskeletal protein n=1 Tax=Aliikangiella marina TaxID=1712262 RepID=A0A545TA85_9GAMM|nr:polymer-forming cytoskeletal protein [Aliikangiella marina]TQV74121.1 polymer-forming cytoskeletal protein [Aliikangiella marina]
MLGRKKNQSPKAKAGAADTLISKEAKINGNISFTGVLHIDGHVQGDITAEEFENSLLTIGQNGYIEGEINVPHIMVFGRVKGDVHALEHIELMSDARIEGNVYYKLIEMAMGAEVNGQMLHKEEKPKLLAHQNKAEAENADKTKAEPSPQTELEVDTAAKS